MRTSSPQTFEERLGQLRQLREAAVNSASEAAIDKQHEKGAGLSAPEEDELVWLAGHPTREVIRGAMLSRERAIASELDRR